MRARVVTPPEAVDEAATLLRAGEIVGLPTETVYGLGANALGPLACSKIFEAKGRPLSDPLIVHVPDASWVGRLGRSNTLAERLAGHFWPGPLTMVVPRQDIVPDLVTAGEETVALRWSAHPIFQAVAAAFGGPIAAPSANRFGRISPTTAQDVVEELGQVVPLVVDGGACTHGIESTIVLVREDGMEILRHGPITQEELSEFGPVREDTSGVAAPGRMKSHYAPVTRVVLAGEEDLSAGKKAGLLAWKGTGAGYAAVEHLSPTQDLREAATNLYGALRRLDARGLDVIVAEPVPEQGLGVAIMERLRKAAA